MAQFKNKQLQFDLERLLSYDCYSYVEITTDYDKELGFILDIKDNSYFYESEFDRDLDELLFMAVLKDNGLF